MNQKTVLLITGYTWTQRTNYTQVRDHRCSEEATTAAAATETQKPVNTETSAAEHS
ncbi:hypothetical protein [Arthrobacter sp. HLT1-21]